MNKIRVIIVSELSAGGVEKVNTMLAEHLCKDSFDITLLSVTTNPNHINTNELPYKCIFLKAKSIKRSLFKFIRCLKEIEPDIILTSILDETIFALLYKQLYNRQTKVIYAQHTVWSCVCSLTPKAHFFNVTLPSILKIFKKIDALVYVSEGVKQDMNQYVKNINTKQVVIYNPITYSNTFYRFKPIDLKSFSIVTIGRLEQEKNQKMIIESIALLKQKGFNATLHIYGSGSLKTELQQYAEKLSITDKVFFEGFSQNIQADIRPYDIFVLTSIYESFGNVIVEAMNVGLPVISTNCPVGPSEILADGKYGKLIPMGDANILTDTIIHTVNNITEKEINKAYQRSLEFSLDTSLKGYQNLFNELISHKS